MLIFSVPGLGGHHRDPGSVRVGMEPVVVDRRCFAKLEVAQAVSTTKRRSGFDDER